MYSLKHLVNNCKLFKFKQATKFLSDQSILFTGKKKKIELLQGLHDFLLYLLVNAQYRFKLLIHTRFCNHCKHIYLNVSFLVFQVCLC